MKNRFFWKRPTSWTWTALARGGNNGDPVGCWNAGRSSSWMPFSFSYISTMVGDSCFQNPNFDTWVSKDCTTRMRACVPDLASFSVLYIHSSNRNFASIFFGCVRFAPSLNHGFPGRSSASLSFAEILWSCEFYSSCSGHVDVYISWLSSDL